MNIIKELFSSDVVPALGCTEPITVAFACSLARYAVSNGNTDPAGISRIKVVTDPGVFKNGSAVAIPNTNGMKGNQIAAALGAISGKPELKLEVLRHVTPEHLASARDMLTCGRVELACNYTWKGLRVEARVENRHEYGLAVIEGGHTNVVICRKGEHEILDLSTLLGGNCTCGVSPGNSSYRNALRKMSVANLIFLARNIDEEDRRYIDQGVSMNLAISEVGRAMGEVGSHLESLVRQGLLSDDIITSAQITVASATDARMSGASMPVMSSGGSGNQGVVAALVPYLAGKRRGIEIGRIQESIALSHLLNTYVKCFLGHLSPMCGCAVAAGIGAAGAIAYQKTDDPEVIGHAINNVIGDIAGILCDGAKSGCSMKVASATQASIRAAFLALSGCSIDCLDGIIGKTPEETIRNLWIVDSVGMQHADEMILKIMANK